VYLADYEMRKMSRVSTIIIALSFFESLLFSVALSTGMLENILLVIIWRSGIMLLMIMSGVMGEINNHIFSLHQIPTY
ncbi:hypothetical protein PMAYCL1PPCAC_32764, partial [Pristionchus mayeri]